MKKIRNITSEAREIAATNQVVEPNHQVEVEDDDLARALLQQSDVWESVSTPKKEK